MNCKNAQKLMYRYLDNELVAKIYDNVSLHLNNCKDCRQRFEQGEQQDNLIRALHESIPDDKFTLNTMARLPKNKNKSFFKLPTLVYSLTFGICFMIGLALNLVLDRNINEREKPYIATLLLQSQDLGLINDQENTIAMILGEQNHEK